MLPYWGTQIYFLRQLVPGAGFGVVLFVFIFSSSFLKSVLCTFLVLFGHIASYIFYTFIDFCIKKIFGGAVLQGMWDLDFPTKN